MFESIGVRGGVRGGGLKAVFLGMSLLIVPGCGGQPAAPQGVDDDAGEAVTVVLDAWKEGMSFEDFRSSDPAFNVAEQDWQAGLTLKDYSLAKAEPNGGNWRVSALITVVSAGKSEQQKRVSYDVTTEPAITVFRFDPED